MAIRSWLSGTVGPPGRLRSRDLSRFRRALYQLSYRWIVVGPAGVEPASGAYKAPALPLSYEPMWWVGRESNPHCAERNGFTDRLDKPISIRPTLSSLLPYMLRRQRYVYACSTEYTITWRPRRVSIPLLLLDRQR